MCLCASRASVLYCLRIINVITFVLFEPGIVVHSVHKPNTMLPVYAICFNFFRWWRITKKTLRNPFSFIPYVFFRWLKSNNRTKLTWKLIFWVKSNTVHLSGERSLSRPHLVSYVQIQKKKLFSALSCVYNLREPKHTTDQSNFLRFASE